MRSMLANKRMQTDAALNRAQLKNLWRDGITLIRARAIAIAKGEYKPKTESKMLATCQSAVVGQGDG